MLDKFIKLIKISKIVFLKNEESEFKAFFAKYLAEKDNQESQTYGYEYELMKVFFSFFI